jgi:hypothetical protein
MYTVDELDTVVKLYDAPSPDVGAPLPTMVCDEHKLFLAYIASSHGGKRITKHPVEVSPHSRNVAIAIVSFLRPGARMFGPPNDEAFTGHPLASRGLMPYAVFEVEQSSWIRQLERMNRVHPNHNPQLFFGSRRHFVFAFHDSTFEVVADGWEVELISGSMRSALATMVQMMDKAG